MLHVEHHAGPKQSHDELSDSRRRLVELRLANVFETRGTATTDETMSTSQATVGIPSSDPYTPSTTAGGVVYASSAIEEDEEKEEP